jgi:ribosomal protein L11 methyltransferase
VADSPNLWKLSLTVAVNAVRNVEARLNDVADEVLVSISDFEAPNDLRVVEALFDRDPSSLGLKQVLGDLTSEEICIAPVADRDWVAESQAALAPIRAGRFFVYGGHDADKLPAGAIGLRIEAAQAFGTGHHATTRGCLLALDDLLKRIRPPRVLDLGCGTGVLAIAAAKVLRRPVMASDIDPVASRITRENARLNRARVTAVTATGLDHPALRRARPYDLIMANILAEPLKELAPAMARALSPSGLAILSGILESQAESVRAACLAAGLHSQRRLTLSGWATLTVQKRRLHRAL